MVPGTLLQTTFFIQNRSQSANWTCPIVGKFHFDIFTSTGCAESNI